MAIPYLCVVKLKCTEVMPTIRINITQQQLQSLHTNGEIIISFSGDNAQGLMADSNHSFFGLINQQIERLRRAGSVRTAETYKSALRQLQRFWTDGDLPLSAVTPDLMEQYQHFLRGRDLTMNTVSFYMRRLRAVYYRAVSSGLTTDCRPFSRVYTGVAKTAKRALSIDDMSRIKQLQIDNPQLMLARDMFLFSFYTRGMAFVDMAYLQKSDLKDGILSYRRHKTGQSLTIRWEPCMQDIVDRHPSVTSQYLLPLISNNKDKQRSQYRYRQSLINHYLKEVGRLAGLTTNLTMYCARHSWATIARDQLVPMNVISLAMGHTNARTTEIYLRSVDISQVDRANEQIIGLL